MRLKKECCSKLFFLLLVDKTNMIGYKISYLCFIILIFSIGLALLISHYNEGFTDKTSVLASSWVMTLVGLGIGIGMIYLTSRSRATVWSNIGLMLGILLFSVGLILMISHYDHDLFVTCDVKVAGFTLACSGLLAFITIPVWGVLSGGNNSITHSSDNKNDNISSVNSWR